jgi:hypothetical protein
MRRINDNKFLFISDIDPDPEVYLPQTKYRSMASHYWWNAKDDTLWTQYIVKTVGGVDVTRKWRLVTSRATKRAEGRLSGLPRSELRAIRAIMRYGGQWYYGGH